MVKQDSNASGVAALTFVVSLFAGLAVPPSLFRADLSDLERTIARASDPLLVAALVFAGSAFLFRDGRLTRRLCLVSLLLINLAGYLAGRFGNDTIGLGGSLLLTVPLFAGIAWSETTRPSESAASKQ